MKKRAFRRKRYNRKRPFYRNRKFRRSVPRFRRPGNVYNFKRTVELENFPVAAGQSFLLKVIILSFLIFHLCLNLLIYLIRFEF